jgi:ribonuclease P protein component
MLSRQNRLKGQANFKKIYNEGKKIWSSYFLIIYLRENTQNPPLIGFVSSKKVGGAVNRNHSRRLLSAIVQPKIATLPLGLECVIIANSKTPETDYFVLKEELEKSLIQLSH